MGRKTQYEYDDKAQVFIRIPTRGSPMVASRTEPHWGNLGSKYESYAQAIYRGQGCWDRLDTISEEKAQEILKEWGCPLE